MTRKHFKDIAETIKNQSNLVGNNADEIRAIARLAYALTADFRRANLNFDGERFLRACGPKVWQALGFTN